jgi:hypothetical protein
MWIVGANSKVRQVPGGRQVEHACAKCRAVRTFVECDVTDGVSAFFVTVFEATQRRFVCVECHDDVAPAEVAAPAPARAASPDDLLAALKKKMGR